MVFFKGTYFAFPYFVIYLQFKWCTLILKIVSNSELSICANSHHETKGLIALNAFFLLLDLCDVIEKQWSSQECCTSPVVLLIKYDISSGGSFSFCERVTFTQLLLPCCLWGAANQRTLKKGSFSDRGWSKAQRGIKIILNYRSCKAALVLSNNKKHCEPSSNFFLHLMFQNYFQCQLGVKSSKHFCFIYTEK